MQIHCRSKVWDKLDFMSFKEVSSAHQDCINSKNCWVENNPIWVILVTQRWVKKGPTQRWVILTQPFGIYIYIYIFGQNCRKKNLFCEILLK